MGKVAIKYRLLPESPDVDINGLTKEISGAVPDGVEIANLSTKPFAFGLTAIEILVIMNDVEGISDSTEKALSEVPGIQTVESLEVSLI